MNLVVIDYKAGNVQSVLFALKRLGVEGKLTADPEQIRTADKVVFPGVGEASSAMQVLQKTGLHKLIPDLKQPTLGICLGMQLLCAHSEEGNTDCLGVFPVRVQRFAAGGTAKLKIPHVGWNALLENRGALYKGIEDKEFVYFVHSYYAGLCDFTTAKTDYINRFSASLEKDNFYAVQFHPEKSGKVGEQILHNFLTL